MSSVQNGQESKNWLEKFLGTSIQRVVSSKNSLTKKSMKSVISKSTKHIYVLRGNSEVLLQIIFIEKRELC